MEKLKIQKKKLIKSILILNISFLFGISTVSTLSEKFKFIKKENAKNMQIVQIFKEEETIYLSHLKEIFNFQLIYLINNTQKNDSIILPDLYNNDIFNLNISKRDLESLLINTFPNDLKELSNRVSTFEACLDDSLDLNFLIEHINKINKSLVSNDFKTSNKLISSFYKIKNLDLLNFLTTSENENLKTILNFLDKN